MPTFIDMCAGIGGFHLAFHNLGAECVFAAENNDYARMTYQHNFQKISPNLFDDQNQNFIHDLTQVNTDDIPDFDVLTAGFPCQPFSQIGQGGGFEDARGTIFFHLARILNDKRPRAFFLENVRNILSHDNGNTFTTIKNILEEDLGYSFQYFVVKASDYGLPQHRPRIFMIGFDDGTQGINVPVKRDLLFTMSNVLRGEVNRDIGFTLRVGGRNSGINDRRNWDGYLVNGEERIITPDEAKMIQGFPLGFSFPAEVGLGNRMKQLGNSVAVSAVEAFAREILYHV